MAHDFRRQSRRMALCGILAALAVVLLSFGALIPFSTFCCPILAMLCIIPVVEEYGRKSALLFYSAVSVLALLLAPDKEVALLFTFLGWYPAVRTALDRHLPKGLLPALVKLLLFAVSVAAMYALAILVFGMAYLAAEYAAEGKAMLLITVFLGCVVWLLCDKVLGRFSLLYRKKWRAKLFRS